MKYLENSTVVVPFDFSDESTKAVDAALELAEESTSLHVVHVVEPMPMIIAADAPLPVAPPYDDQRFEHAQEAMKKHFGDGEYARFKIHCEVGDPGSTIVKYANDASANLIVMPSHGRTGLSRLLMGSVAERVLRLSSCPVLVFR